MSQIDKATIREAFNVLERVSMSTKTAEKMELLTEKQSNAALVELLERGLASKSYRVTLDDACGPRSNTQGTMDSRWAGFLELLSELEDPGLEKEEAYARTKKLLIRCAPLENKWYGRVLSQKLGLGLQKKTLLSCCTGASPSPAKAKKKVPRTSDPVPEAEDLVEPFKLWVEPNYKGLRCLAVVNDAGETRLYTKEEQGIPKAKQIVQAVQALGACGRVYEGWLVVQNKKGIDWKKSQALEAKNITAKTPLALHLFDTVPLKTYNAGKSKAPFYKRRRRLFLLLENNEKTCLELVKRRKVEGHKAILAYQRKVHARGFPHGVLVKNPYGVYGQDDELGLYVQEVES